MIRPPLHVDYRYGLALGIAALVAAALMVIAAIAGAAHLDDGTPPPTTYPAGDGDRVVVTPRSLP